MKWLKYDACPMCSVGCFRYQVYWLLSSKLVQFFWFILGYFVTATRRQPNKISYVYTYVRTYVKIRTQNQETMENINLYFQSIFLPGEA